MKKLLVPMTALLLMLLGGCQKEENGNRSGEMINLTADLSQGEVTKVDVDFNTDKAEVFWTDGDGVSVFGADINTSANKYLGLIKTSLTERTKKAVFEGQVEQSGNKSYYVFYPYSASHVENDGSGVPLDLESQIGKVDDFTYLSNYMYMLGKEPCEMDSENRVVFYMEHACAILQFNVMLQDAKEGVTLKTIAVSGENIKNKKTLDVYNKKIEDVASAGNKITLSYPDGGPALSTAEVTVAMTAFPAESGNVDVAVTVDNNGKEQTITIPGVVVAFEAGKRYTKTLKLDVPDPDAETVYVAGFDYSTLTALLWVNGVAQQLSVDGISSAQAMSVYVSGNDIYAAGSGRGESSSSGAALLWKNGVGAILTDGTSITQAASVYVSGNDVYVAGSAKENNLYVATLWKNGVAEHLVEGATNSTLAQTVYVSGSDVYAAGYESSTNRTATLWKNGTLIPLSDGVNRAEAKSICVSGDDVYVAGYDGKYAVLWTNSVAQNLTDGTKYAQANSVYVYGSNVYVVGNDGDSAILWTNGVAEKLPDLNSSAEALSVHVVNGDIYVAGYDVNESGNPIGIYWKNKVLQQLSDNCMAYSIFVK